MAAAPAATQALNFKSLCQLTHPSFSSAKSSRRAAQEGVTTASSGLVVPRQQDRYGTSDNLSILIGISDGRVLWWDNLDPKTLSSERSADQAKSPTVLQAHQGDVRVMIHAPELYGGVVLTGSSDRTIKIWTLHDKKCVTTLHGHAGSILAMHYGEGMLLSSATDSHFFIWTPPNADILRFPRLKIQQKIGPDVFLRDDPIMRKKSSDYWITSMTVREGDGTISILCGDSGGFLQMYVPDEDSSNDFPLYILLKKIPVHTLSILTLLAVPQDSILISSSYDHEFRTLDSLSLQKQFTQKNPDDVPFSALAWCEQFKEIYAGDGKGNLGVYNIHTESCVDRRELGKGKVKMLYVQKLGNDKNNSTKTATTTTRLLALTPHALHVQAVHRGLRYAELKKHTQPIVGLVSTSSVEGSTLYSLAADNHLRFWDVDSQSCMKKLVEKESEPTAMVLLPTANALITGHEGSQLKMWSLDNPNEPPTIFSSPTGKARAHTNSITAIVVISGQEWLHHLLRDDNRRKGDEFNPLFNEPFEMVVAGGYDCRLSFWRIIAGEVKGAPPTYKFDHGYKAHQYEDDEILCLCYNFQENCIFTGGSRGNIQKRKLSLFEPELHPPLLRGHRDAVNCLASIDSRIFSGSVDRTIRVWDAETEDCLMELNRHVNINFSIQHILLHENLIIACGLDHRVVLLESETYSHIKTFEQQEKFVRIHVVGKQILAGGESGNIVVFPLPAEEERVISAFQKEMEKRGEYRGERDQSDGASDLSAEGSHAAAAAYAAARDGEVQAEGTPTFDLLTGVADRAKQERLSRVTTDQPAWKQQAGI